VFIAAVTNGSSMAQCSGSPVRRGGRSATITPASPMPTPSQRRGETFSPSSAARATVSTGAANITAVASASGTWISATDSAALAITKLALRSVCSTGERDRRAATR
jgi:hypothetical protein